MTSGSDIADIVGADEILKLIPHRYPFLLVDRITAINGDQSCIGIKNVTFNEPFFQGHFPGRPVMPGVLIIEGMAQTAGAVVVRNLGWDGSTAKTFFLTIDKAKFRHLVVPGDVVEYHITKIKQRRLMWWFRGEAKVADRLVAEAELGAMIAKP